MSQNTLIKKLARVKPGTVFIGVDLALDRNVAVILSDQARRLARFGFPNTRAGYDYFYQQVEAVRERHQAAAVVVGMEPTNYFWKLLAADLEAHQPAYEYHLVNPYTVNRSREGEQLDRSKDDNRDAFTIAELLRTGKYTETRLLHAGYAELRQYGTLYYRLQRDLQRQETLIHNLVGQLFPELRQIFRDLTGETVRALLWQHAAASQIRHLSLDSFMVGVRADFTGQRLQLARLRQVHALAAQSVGLSAGVEALQVALRLHIATFEAFQQQVAAVEIAFFETFQALPEANYWLSVPGLGVATAALILAEIGNPGHYRHGRQWAKLAGIQPVLNTSGRKSRSRTPMSHQGRPRLRTVLFFAVLRLVRLDETFAREYQRLQSRPKNPLTKNQALGVLMNKLLRILWGLIRQQTTYQPGGQLPA
jgi:transposase